MKLKNHSWIYIRSGPKFNCKWPGQENQGPEKKSGIWIVSLPSPSSLSLTFFSFLFLPFTAPLSILYPLLSLFLVLPPASAAPPETIQVEKSKVLCVRKENRSTSERQNREREREGHAIEVVMAEVFYWILTFLLILTLLCILGYQVHHITSFVF